MTQDHLVITVHGIRTFGQWQERLEQCLKEEAHDTVVYHHKYGYFSIIAFLIPPLRWLVTREFRRQLLRLVAQRDWRRIDIVAHSFGTHLVGHGLKGISADTRPKIHTVILAGSVLKMNFDWGALIPAHVTRVINECGYRDHVLLINQLLVLMTGMAGRVGFRGMFNENTFQNRFFKFGHSDYFRTGKADDDSFMRDKWLPLLTAEDPIVPFPDTRSSSWHGFATFLLNNAEPVKILLWVTPLLMLVQYVDHQRSLAVEQRTIATKRLADALVFNGDALLAEDDYSGAYERYAEAQSLAITQTEERFFGLIRSGTTKPQRNWTSDLAFWNLFRQWRPPIQAIETAARIDIMRLSDEAKSAVVAEGRQIEVWDLLTQTKSSDLTKCSALRNSADTDDLPTPAQVWISEEQSPYWGDLAISPSGGRIAIGDLWGSLTLCRTDTAEIIWSRNEEIPISTLRFAGEGKLLIAGFNDGSVRIFDTRNGRLQQVLDAHSGPVRAAIMSFDSSLIATLGPVGARSRSQIGDAEGARRHSYVGETDSHMVRVFASATGQVTAELESALSSSAAVFREDGTIVSLGTEGVASWTRSQITGDFELLDRSDAFGVGLPYAQRGLLSPHGNYVREPLTGGGMTSVDAQREYDALTVRRLQLKGTDQDRPANERTLPGAAVSLSAVQFSSDERLLVGVLGTKLLVWDLEDRDELPIQPLWARHGATTLDFSFDDRLVLAKLDDRTVALHDAGTSEVLRTYPSHEAEITAVALDLRGERVLAGDASGRLVAYTLRSGEVDYELQLEEPPRTIELLGDGSRLAVSFGTALQVWRPAARELVYEIKCDSNHKGLIAVSGNGKQFSLACDGSIRSGSFQSPSETLRIDNVDDPTAIALSRDGLRLAWSESYAGVISLTALPGDIRQASDRDATGYIGGIGFLDGDQFLVSTGSGDRSLTFWDTRTLRPVRKFPALYEGGGPIRVTPSGQRVLTDGAYGQMLFWDFQSSAALRDHFSRNREDAMRSLPLTYASIGNCSRSIAIFEANPSTEWVAGTIEKLGICYVRLQRFDAARKVFALAKSELGDADVFFDLWLEHLDTAQPGHASSASRAGQRIP